MFDTLRRSWEFAKISYGIIWDFKQLIVFPVFSSIAAVAVMASFIAPLWATGTLEQWMAFIDPDAAAQPTAVDQAVMWITLFLFYFCSYFVIVFFNCALTACAMKVVSGETPTLGYGLSMAGRRLPQIAAWAFISAVIGVLLRVIENMNEKIGSIVAAILGTAWTALTYFVVPVLVMQGVGPITAIRQSVGTLKSTWGEALAGNFSMGILGFLVMLPLLVIIAVLVGMAYLAGNTAGLVLAAAIGGILVVIACATMSAADVVFKALLYNYATGESVPANVDTSHFQDAFRHKEQFVRSTTVFLVAWTTLALIALGVALAGMAIDPVASVEAGRANARALWPLWLAGGAVWLGLSALWWRWRAADAPCGSRLAVAVIIAGAVVPRAVVLVTHEPALSDDVYRYVFDGRNLAAGFNPYLVPPEDRIAPADAPRWPGEADIASRVNNPELTTIYLPTSQWVFGATGRVLGAGAPTVPGATRAFRTALVIIEIAAIGLLLVLLGRAGIGRWSGALYAWHPLAIVEVAGSGHQESIGLLLVVAALLLWRSRPKRVAGWTALLAVAALVKPVVIPVVPLLLRGRALRAWIMSALYGAMVCGFVAWPLLLGTSGDPLGHLRATATRFSLKWAHFGSAYEPLLWIIERFTPDWGNDPQEQLARGFCLVLLATMTVAVYVARRGPWLGAQLVLLLMVLFSPAAHPWYLLWALILAPLGRSLAVWIASLTIMWGYAAWRYRVGADGGIGWGVSPWLVAGAWVPVWIALVYDWEREASPDQECQ